MLAIIVPVAILLVVYGGLALIAWRRPLLGRLAWREAVRRPAHSALLVGGMMFGTAAILGMQGVGDTFARVTSVEITHAWGRTDITVSQGGEPFSAAVGAALAADPRVAAGAAGVQGAFVLTGSVADLDRRLSTSPVQINSLDPTSPGFGTFSLRDGRTIDGSSLAGDQTIVSSLLAGRLEAQQGDRIQIDFVVGGRSERLDLRVAALTKPGDVLGIGQQPVIFVTLAAIQGAAGAGLVNIVRVSAKGDGQQEIDNARTLAPAVRTLVAATPGGTGLEVREVKAQDLAANDQQGGPTRSIFLALSLFVVVGASALVVNLSLALAEERRPRLAVLRALGLKRTGLVTVAVMEGAIYSLAAAIAGVLPGIAYTYLLDMRRLPDRVASETASGSSAEFFNITAASIALAICVGALITLLTIFIVSMRTSRMAISSAIRDLPEPARPRRRSWLGLVWPLILGAVGLAALLLGDSTYRAIGGAALIVAASVLARGKLPEKVRASLTGAALVVWEVVSLLTAPIETFALGNGIVLSFAALGIAVFGAALLISANLRLLELGIRFVSGRLVATVRPPLAYLTRRPVRAGLATGAFALVLASLAFFALLIPSSGPDASTRTNGYDVRVTAIGAQSFSVPDSLQGQVVDTESITTLAYVGPVQTQLTGSSSSGWQTGFAQLYRLTDNQLSNPPLALSTRDPRYASDAAAWLAIREDPSLVVTNQGFLGQVGFAGNAGVVRLQVIGVVADLILGNDVAPGYFGSQNTFTSLSISGQGATVLIKTAQGVNVSAFTRALRMATFSQGVDAVSRADLVNVNNQTAGWFTAFFVTLLRTAVIVAVLSFGILALRAAIERRRTIGVLRALGYRPTQVVGGLLTEAIITATVGIVAGTGVGLAIGWAYLAASGTAQPQVDLAQILVPVVLIYAAVLLVTIGPAVRASRMHASEALRIVG
jgi:putative ABC transport system permease protein